MQSKKTACHNIISTFYSLTPMSHFSLFESLYSIVQKAAASQFFAEYE